MSTFGEDLIQSLKESIAHAQGNGPAIVHSPITPHDSEESKTHAESIHPESPHMQILEDLAHAIDSASDAGDEALLRQLAGECERRLATAEGVDRVRLRYYQSNTYSAVITAKQNDDAYIWSWEQPDGIQNILLLRQAISEPAFEVLDPIITCQIRTNLANRLNNLGRSIAANEQWLKVLKTDPRFAKALASRAQGISFYAGKLYDYNHTPILLAAARDLYDKALDEDAFWESGDRNSIASALMEERRQIADYLLRNQYNEEFNLNQWSLGATEEERAYRHWCLRERLFLNPLNEAYTESVAASDVLHLPNHTYDIEDAPRFPSYYNLMKQEYVSARYRLYRATHEGDPEFLMRDVLMLDSGEGQVLGHFTEDLRSAFRSSYAIFDKVGLFLNDYFQFGLNPRKVNFRNVWYEPNKSDLRAMFRGRPNLPLRGLYFLSHDLFDKAFAEVAEPDAANLARLRHQVEHRFLSFQHIVYGESTETHRLMSVEDFRGKALHLLKMAREALIYVSLAMHREEALRREGDGKAAIASIPSRRIELFQRL